MPEKVPWISLQLACHCQRSYFCDVTMTIDKHDTRVKGYKVSGARRLGGVSGSEVASKAPSFVVMWTCLQRLPVPADSGKTRTPVQSSGVVFKFLVQNSFSYFIASVGEQLKNKEMFLRHRHRLRGHHSYFLYTGLSAHAHHVHSHWLFINFNPEYNYVHAVAPGNE